MRRRGHNDTHWPVQRRVSRSVTDLTSHLLYGYTGPAFLLPRPQVVNEFVVLVGAAGAGGGTTGLLVGAICVSGGMEEWREGGREERVMDEANGK